MAVVLCVCVCVSVWVCVCVCVCVCLTELAATYACAIRLSVLLSTYVEFVWISLKTLCSKVLVKFADHLCLLRFLMNSRWTRDSDGFFSRRLVCRTNNRSYNSTDSSLITVDYQQSLLPFFFCKTADQAHAWSCCILRNHVQLHMRILVVTLNVYYSLHCSF